MPDAIDMVEGASEIDDEVHETPPLWTVTDDWSIPPPPAREWTVPGWVPADRVTLTTGAGGVGKSRLAIMLAYAKASGARRWFAHDTGPLLDGARSHVVFCSWEDEMAEVQRRLYDHPSLDGQHAPSALRDRLENRLAFMDLAAAGPLWLDGKMTDVGGDVRAECERREAGLLIVDPLAAAYGDDENDRGCVRSFMASWNSWAARKHCATLFIAHPPKNAATYSGSTDWRNASRAMLVLEDVDGRFRLSADKQSYGPKPDPLELRDWRWWSASPWEAEDDDAELDEALIASIRRKAKNKTETARDVGRQQRRVSLRIDTLLARGLIRETMPGNRHTKYELSDSSDSKS